MLPVRRFWLKRLLPALGCVATLSWAGCGGGTPAPEPAATTSAPTAAPKAAAVEAPAQPASGSAAAPAPATGRKPSVDGIPLDVVFFENPLEVSSDTTPVGTPKKAGTVAATTPATTAPAAGTPMPDKPADAPKPAAGGAVVWAEVIPAAVLQDEMKTLRNELQQRLTNFGAYGRANLEVPVFASTMALLAEIGRVHTEEVPWKEQAKFIRALSAEMSAKAGGATARNKGTYDEINAAFQKICEILDKNKPDLPETPDEQPLAEVADLGYLMKRLDRGEQWLQTNAGSEDGFKSKSDGVKREAAVLQAIAVAIGTESYGFAEDEIFLGHSGQFRDALKGMFKANEDKNFSEYDLMRSNAKKKCDECHNAGYRSG